MADIDKWSIDELDSNNWPTWKFQMKHLLLANGPARSTVQEEELKDVLMSISESLLYLITSCKVPIVAWATLQDHFE